MYSPAIKVIGNISIAVVLTTAAGGCCTAHRGRVLAAFLLYLRASTSRCRSRPVLQQPAVGTAALEKLARGPDEPPAVPEPRAPVRLPAPRELAFDGVVFAYDAAAPYCRSSICSCRPADDRLVGATGAGSPRWPSSWPASTTRPPARSRRRRDLRSLAEDDLRRAIVMVTQENTCSPARSRRTSLRPAGRPRAEIEAAAARSGRTRYPLPAHGYDTDVRKRGGRLRRAAAARGVRAGLLPTRGADSRRGESSLDIRASAWCSRRCATILSSRTALVIAHRLSTWRSPTACWCCPAAGSSRTARRRP